MKPRARSGLITRPVGDEVVVYDPRTHTAHCLNPTAAAVFSAADGRTSVAEIAARLGAASGAAEGAHADAVWAALDQLAAAQLVEAPRPPAGALAASASSRREALRRVGLGVAALAPVVVSLVVPTPAEAINTCIPASACNTSNFGQPCYAISQAECASKQCTGTVGDCQ